MRALLAGGILRAAAVAALWSVVSGSAAVAGSTTTSIASSLNPSRGESVTFSAQVIASGDGVPAGSVQFMDGANTLGDPVTVNTLGAGSSIAASHQFACAVTVAGGVKCWGLNFIGQLGPGAGNGGFGANPTPGDVGLSGIVAVATGERHACAVTSAGGVKCWGDNSSGQIGSDTYYGTSNPNPNPVDVDVSGIVGIAAGGNHTCALTGAGGVKCWGNNAAGQLGSGLSVGASWTPLDTGLTDIVAVSAGLFHTCALTGSGRVKCFGNDSYGDLPDLTDIVAISAGSNHTCALAASGSVTCRGNNSRGQLGDLSGFTGVAAIAAGHQHTCALTMSGGAKCWGWNIFGQLGSDPAIVGQSSTPLDIGLTDIVAIDAGYYHTCAVTAAGAIKCWGLNNYGDLGQHHGVVGDSSFAPVDVTDFGGGATRLFGMARLSTAQLAAGSHTITAVYSGGDDHAGSTSDALTQQVNAAPAITSAPSATFTVGASGSFAITTTGTPTPSLSATGSLPGGVSFTDNGDGTATLAGTPGIGTGGVHVLTVKASNGVDPDAQQSLTLTVNQSAFVPSTDYSGRVGVSFNALIIASGYPAPSITLESALPNGLSLTPGTGGTATISGTPTTGAGGTHNVTIKADNGVGAAATQTIEIVIERTYGLVTLTASPDPAKVGQPITLTSGVFGPATPTGTVTFKKGNVELGTAALAGQTASLSNVTLPVGTHSLTAQYNGNTDIQPTYGLADVTVEKGEVTIALSSLPAIGRAGETVTLRANVSAIAPAPGTPTGTVTFKEGGKVLGEGTIAGGRAQTSVSGLKIGPHNVTATYSGDSAFARKAVSATVQVKAGLGQEARANTFTDGAQQYPSIAKTKNGYVIVWASNAQDGNKYGIYGQRFNNNAVPQGPEFHVSVETERNQTMPKVAGLTGGTFIAVWQSNVQDGSSTGIYGRRYTAAGVAGAEFKVNTTTKGAQSQPAMAPLSDGGFVVAWTGPSGIFAQRYDAKAKPVGFEFKANTTSGGLAAPSVASLSDEGFVIVWQGEDEDGLGIFGQRYTSAGAKAGRQITINKTKAGDQSLPSVTGIDSGGFVVAWQSAEQDGSGLGVYAQRFNVSGGRAGGEIRVNTMTANDQGQPRVSAFSDGGFAVLWTSDLQDGSGKGVYAQVFTDAGAKVDAEFLINTTTTRDQSQAAVAAASAGSFMAAWTSRGTAHTATDVYTQRFQVPLPQ